MKVLYANPIFLDYRIPFFQQLNKLFNGNFYILYSTNRYIGRFDDLLARIPKELGKSAIPYTKEKTFYFDSFSFKYKAVAREKPKRFLPYAIPFPFGLYKMIKGQRPDVLITEGFYQWTPLLCVYAKIHHIPIFLSYERTMYTERNVSKIKTIQRKMVDKLITGYFVNGKETIKYLKSIGINSGKIFVGGMNADSEGLRNSIAAYSKEDKIAFRRNFIDDGGGLIFLFSGQMIERKGVKHLLESWIEHVKKYNNDKLILIGGGPLYNQYSKQYKGVPSIYMEGRIPYNIVYKYYAIADVFILPTIEDNWSLVIPEAMACGLPVATSIYNGCHSELVKKGINGITFDTYNHETIIEALGYFHTQDLKLFGKNSIKLEEPFNAINSAKRIYQVLSKYNK